MAPAIFIALNNAQQGPYTLAQIQQMLAEKKVTIATLAWKEGLAEWIPLRELLAPPDPAGRQANPLGQYPGWRRLYYAGAVISLSLLAAAINSLMLNLGHKSVLGYLKLTCIPLAAYFVYLRLKNIGCSGWWALLVFSPLTKLFGDLRVFFFFVPLGSLLLQIFALSAPPGYKFTRKYDAPGIIIVCLAVLLLLVGVMRYFLARQG